LTLVSGRRVRLNAGLAGQWFVHVGPPRVVPGKLGLLPANEKRPGVVGKFAAKTA
jgi:hypothetical protein